MWCIRRFVVAALYNTSSITNTAVAAGNRTSCVLKEGALRLNITPRRFIVCNSGDVHLVTFNASKGKVIPL